MKSARRLATTMTLSAALIGASCTGQGDDASEAVPPTTALVNPETGAGVMGTLEFAPDGDGSMRCYEQIDGVTDTSEYYGLTTDEAAALAAETGDYVLVLASEGSSCGRFFPVLSSRNVYITITDGVVHTASGGQPAR